MIFHAVNMAIVNNWLEYKEHCYQMGMNKDIIDLLDFKKRFALNVRSKSRKN